LQLYGSVVKQGAKHPKLLAVAMTAV